MNQLLQTQPVWGYAYGAMKKATDMGKVSDGNHTFEELYEHVYELWIALCASRAKHAWRTDVDGQGKCAEGWFILGLYCCEGEQLSYQLPRRLWDRCKFASTMDQAPPWDGHTPEDVLNRLKSE